MGLWAKRGVYLSILERASERSGRWAAAITPFALLFLALALFLLGLTVEKLEGRWLPAAAVAGICALVFFVLGKLNQWAADKLQDQIDALNALEKEP